MTTEERGQGAPGARRTRPNPDPLQMTEVEKRIAEWEARHDVAARGRRAAPDLVQHYIAHSRLTQGTRPRPAAAPAANERPRPRPSRDDDAQPPCWTFGV